MNQTSDDTAPMDITVRPMRPGEKPEVRKMFRRSFPLLLRLFFSWSPHTLVAERGSKLLGAIVLKTYPLSGGRKGGFVSWIFTAPEARGSGAGQHLIEAALDLFVTQGCDEVAASVEGYNAS
jgi:GNAT superfamily N-acetyltransferase